jgi:5-hydroxyisourate hydrolase
MEVKDTNISTHVLDTAIGIPASGLKIQLFKSSNADTFTGESDLDWSLVSTQETNKDGRAKFEFDIDLSIYKMVFFTYAYFQKQAVPNFYPKVEVIFQITDASRHHHVPLLISPFGYSTYRGS